MTPSRLDTLDERPATWVRLRTTSARLVLLAGPAAAAWVVDAVSKGLALGQLDRGPVLIGPLALELTFNPVGAMGLGAGTPGWVVPTVAVVVLIGVVLAGLRVSRRAIPPLGLVLGGGLANLVDRLPDGVVTDFLSVGWWPTFNLADVAVCIGAVWFALQQLRGRSPARTATPSPLRSEGGRDG